MHIHTIQLNIENLLGGTLGMDATEFGAYMSLIIACYQSKNNLPNDDVKLARMARTSLKTWKRIRPVIEKKFTVRSTSWSNERVQKEIVNYNRVSLKNKANALKKNKTGEPLATHSQANGTDIYNLSSNNQIKIRSMNGSGFDIKILLSDNAWQDARSQAPGWDINHLAGVYNDWVNGGAEKPRAPNKAFPAWCKKITHGKRPP